MGFDAAFAEMERNRIKFSTYKALENYPLYHAWSTGNMDYQPDTAYLSCIKKLIKEDEKLLVLKEYQEGMASFGFVDQYVPHEGAGCLQASDGAV